MNLLQHLDLPTMLLGTLLHRSRFRIVPNLGELFRQRSLLTAAIPGYLDPVKQVPLKD
jgi:hypothetical protein